MAIFAVIYRYVDDPDGLAEHRPAHRDFIGSFLDSGALIASGRMEDSNPLTALLLFSFHSREGLEAALDPDPYWAKGLIGSREIMEWTVSLGSLGLNGEL
jgi:uncharacterized protein YciI